MKDPDVTLSGRAFSMLFIERKANVDATSHLCKILCILQEDAFVWMSSGLFHHFDLFLAYLLQMLACELSGDDGIQFSSVFNCF